MKRAPLSRLARREQLLLRCQRERYELVAATAATLALVPRARTAAHWIRATSRMLRVIAASLRVHS
jgi:hypothetical protein